MSCYKNSQHTATKKVNLQIHYLIQLLQSKGEAWSGMDNNPFYSQVPLKIFTETKKMKLLILKNLYI